LFINLDNSLSKYPRNKYILNDSKDLKKTVVEERILDVNSIGQFLQKYADYLLPHSNLKDMYVY